MAKNIQINLNNLLASASVKNDAIIGVALSGGIDSMVLCHALISAGARVVAINVEHGIRGENSKSDSAFVKSWCDENGITFYGYSVDALSYSKENGYSIEQGARVLRYNCFEDALSKGYCDIIATAHHLDDQVETMLMRMIRGTGINGLVGMQKVRAKYIKPLLDYSRDDITSYAMDNSIPYVEDESNLDTTYTRNFLREQLKVLKDRFPSMLDNFARLQRNVKEDNDFINSLVGDVDIRGDEVYIRIGNLSPSIQKRLIYKALATMGVSVDIEDRHVSSVIALDSMQNGKRIALPYGIWAYKDNDLIVFAKQKKADRMDSTPFAIGSIDKIGIDISVVDKEYFASNFMAEREQGSLFFDLDKLIDGCVFRNREDGDYIHKFGGGKKSLGDFLTDKKLPARYRDNLIVLAKDSEIFAVCGVEISRKIAVDEDSVNIAKLTVKNV